MTRTSGNAIFSAVLALMLAGLACSFGSTKPTAAPATASAPTQRPTTAATHVASTEVPGDTETETASTAAAATEAATGVAPTKAALSGNLDVKGVSTYVDSAEYFHVVGLVTNGTDKPVENIELSVQVAASAGKTVLKDDSGNPTSTVSVNTLLTTLDSGESTPFDFEMSSGGADTSAWKPTVHVATSDTPSELQRVPVDIIDPQISIHSDGQIYVTGELANKSDKPALVSDFASAMLDAAGNVAGAARSSGITRLLSPAGAASGSDRTPFVISIYGPVKQGATPAYYLDAVEGNPDELTAASDLHLRLDTRYVDPDNGVHVVATISNSGTNTVTVQVVAGLYDQAGKVLDADSVSTAFELVPGGSTPAMLYAFGNLNGNADEIARVVSYTAQIDPFFSFPTSLSVVALTASNVVTEPSGSTVTIKGDIVNTTQENIETPDVIVEAKDADGRIVAADWTGTSADSPIKPGQKVTFSLSMQVPAKTDASKLTFDVAVQSTVAQ